jgi:hypothetical protein
MFSSQCLYFFINCENIFENIAVFVSEKASGVSHHPEWHRHPSVRIGYLVICCSDYYTNLAT